MQHKHTVFQELSKGRPWTQQIISVAWKEYLKADTVAELVKYRKNTGDSSFLNMTPRGFCSRSHAFKPV